MSIKLRLIFLLVFLLTGLLAAVGWLRHLERAERAQLYADERATRAQLLNHWVEVTTRTLPQFTAETAQSDPFAKLLAQADSDETRRQIVAALGSALMDALWVLANDGSVRTFVSVETSRPGTFPLAQAEFATLVAETPSPRFFTEERGGLSEVAIRRLPQRNEWLAVARRWDDAQLRTLSQLTESNVSLRDAAALARPPTAGANIELVRPLPDWRGRTLRVLHLENRAEAIERSLAADWQQAQVFIAFGCLLVFSAGLAVHSWVFRPLDRIGRSLAQSDPALARDVAREKHEFGRLAQLVVNSFEHRAALQKEIDERARAQAALQRSELALRENIEERARLGRDLHDGVIQQLYAAGMGLAGIRTLLRADQMEAAVRLEQTRAALNETIHDVRNFIIGLEPEALKLQTFSQAVHALIEVMRGMRSFEATVEIDEALAARLSLSQRVHALQIAREAVSNALRHGAAQRVHITLRTQDHFAEFAVTDDGTGFDPTAPSSGRGLQNFAERARELDATFSVQSEPGKGTRVTLRFAISSP